MYDRWNLAPADWRNGTDGHCLWCGFPLPPSAPGMYCDDQHQTLANEKSAATRQGSARGCPSKSKMRISDRGTAFRLAIREQQFPYRCVCGVYHLTSQAKAGRWCEPLLAELAAALDRRLVNRHGERFLTRLSPRRREVDALPHLRHRARVLREERTKRC